jgi:NodT family efflux transporter outer membrane factor (OMF) lipoprotein
VPATTIPASYEEIGIWTPASPKDDQPREAWWTAFNDATLNDLEGRVGSGNPTLAAALASYDQSQAYADEASASILPWLSFSGSATTNRQSDKRPLRGSNQPNEYGNNQLGLSANYELDFWGRIRNAIAAGRAQAQASAADLATAQLSLEAQLADAYINLRGLDAESQLLANTVAAYQRALDLVQTRHDGGIASGLDLDRANTQLAVAKAQTSDIAAARALYEHAIATLVGEPASNFTLAAAPGIATIPKIPIGVPATLLERRPDIASAERETFAANASIGVARAAFFPRVTLFGGAGFQNTGSGNLLALPYSVWSLGPSISLPLFEGGFLHAQLAVARAQFAKASADYRGTVLAAFQQVEDNLSQTNLLAAESVDQHQAVQDAEATAALSLTRYREGVVNYLDVVTAQTAALEAERTSIGLRTRREHAAVGLIRSLGGGWATTDLATNRPGAPFAPAAQKANTSNG